MTINLLSQHAYSFICNLSTQIIKTKQCASDEQ